MKRDQLAAGAACAGVALLVYWYTKRLVSVKATGTAKSNTAVAQDSDARYQQESQHLLNLLYTLAEDQARKGRLHVHAF
jgi:hypothetical protein